MGKSIENLIEYLTKTHLENEGELRGQNISDQNGLESFINFVKLGN